MTRDEAIAHCLATSSWRRADCAEVVDDHMVNGAYCDGSVYRDERGVRCIPASVIEQKRAAASPAVYVPPPLPTPRWAVPLVLSLSVRALFALSDALGVE